jgi:hypothetical protein
MRISYDNPFSSIPTDPGSNNSRNPTAPAPGAPLVPLEVFGDIIGPSFALEPFWEELGEIGAECWRIELAEALGLSMSPDVVIVPEEVPLKAAAGLVSEFVGLRDWPLGTEPACKCITFSKISCIYLIIKK